MLVHHILVGRWNAVLDPKLDNELGKVVLLVDEVILGDPFRFDSRLDVL